MSVVLTSIVEEVLIPTDNVSIDQSKTESCTIDISTLSSPASPRVPRGDVACVLRNFARKWREDTLTLRHVTDCK